MPLPGRREQDYQRLRSLDEEIVDGGEDSDGDGSSVDSDRSINTGFTLSSTPLPKDDRVSDGGRLRSETFRGGGGGGRSFNLAAEAARRQGYEDSRASGYGYGGNSGNASFAEFDRMEEEVRWRCKKIKSSLKI
jgi:hypothetical protein